MNSENSKTNEPHKFVLNFLERLDFRSSNEYVALQNVSIYHTWKNITKQHKNKNINQKVIAPTSNDEFELPDGSCSVSDIQDYIEYIIKKYETLATISPIHVYINRINNRLVFKIKDMLELQTPRTMKLFTTTKKLIDRTKNGENVPSLEVVEVVLV